MKICRGVSASAPGGGLGPGRTGAAPTRVTLLLKCSTVAQRTLSSSIIHGVTTRTLTSMFSFLSAANAAVGKAKRLPTSGETRKRIFMSSKTDQQNSS
ncbi:hypothetical protein SJA_C1-07030 [Sphingobium indicum UT26S]|uniref:Uncharacterized protein n=1 Tax=Sphingobium indicum (strain DSM 16413 / CCM 7287 / MTCC 6362 / UT26 / NBRC 101211 / UT26S) TaxID=452662 RepID=D4YYV5_SPHIU|nr:hypothetical protein SJA_C1-07030 [Sphingobium indicum UT26S]